MQEINSFTPHSTTGVAGVLGQEKSRDRNKRQCGLFRYLYLKNPFGLLLGTVQNLYHGLAPKIRNGLGNSFFDSPKGLVIHI